MRVIKKMPPTKRFTGILNCCIPGHINGGLENVARAEKKTRSETVREILELGLQAKGIDCI